MHTKREPWHPALWGYCPTFQSGIDAARPGLGENLCKEKLDKREYLLTSGSVAQVFRACNAPRATCS
jgi:hypothetical protein